MSMTAAERQEVVEATVLTLQKVQKRNRNDQGRGHPRLGQVLVEHMGQHGYTQSELATEIDRHHTFVNKIVNGERGVSISTLALLSEVLGGIFVVEYLATLRSIERGDDV